MKHNRIYKDSSYEWFGDIPAEWRIVKIKHIVEGIKDGTHGTFKRVATGRPLLSAKNVFESGVVIGENESLISEQDYLQITSNGYPRKGDILLCSVGTIGRSCVYEHNEPFAFQRSVMFLRPNQLLVYPSFLQYYIQSIHFQNEMHSKINITAQGGVYMGTVSNMMFLLPSLNTQCQIINYLDKKTVAIDNVISEKERLIQLLKEKRQVIISQVVTKGLDSTVKMRDSKIEWIGNIPESWGITKIKYNTYVKGRIGWQGLKSDEFIDEGAYLVTGTDLINGNICWDTCYHIGDERYDEAPEIQLRNGDLLITKDGTIGKVAIVKDMPDRAILNSGLFVTRPINNAYLTKYMYWILNSNVFWRYFSYFETGSTIKHLYQETFVNFSFPLPTLNEQERISDFLDSKTSVIDNSIADIVNQIDKLKEYRQSIISEAVTGKVVV